MVGITVELQGSVAGISAAADGFANLPSKRSQAIARIMREGVVHNYRALAMGGTIPAAGGGDVRWSRVRSRMTIAIRQSRGLGALFPILTLTGKLGRGLVGGTATVGASGYISYAPTGDSRALIATHQLGLRPLPSKTPSAGRSGNVPRREILFWSREMERQVLALADAAIRGAQAK